MNPPTPPAVRGLKPRKLCFVCEATQGGVRTHLRDLLQVFLRPEENFDILGIFGDRGEEGFTHEMNALAAQHSNFRFQCVPDMRRSLNPLRDWRAYKKVGAILAGFKPDIVHTHSAKAGFIGRMAARNLGVPRIIHTPHVFPFQWDYSLRGRLFLALERRAAQAADVIVCVSESQRADALERGLCGASKLVVVKNAIQFNPERATQNAASRGDARNKLELPENASVAGMVARLAPQKGLGDFVRAAGRVLSVRPGTIFVLVGGGPLEAELRSRAAALKIPPENFRVLGHREDAESLYPAFDVLVLSSLYEGLPYVLLEAMARGIPVVATDVLGSRDVVAEGETGLLARVNDPADIAAKIVSLLDDPQKLKRFGAASIKRVKNEFSFDEFVSKHRALYRD